MLFIKKFQICQGSCCPAFILHWYRKTLPCEAPTTPLTPVIILLSIAKRNKYPCHAKQWPTTTSQTTEGHCQMTKKM